MRFINLHIEESRHKHLSCHGINIREIHKFWRTTDTVDDPSPESLNAQQNAVEQPSNAAKELGYEDTTNNREIIQDAVAFQMDPVNTSTPGTPVNGNEV